MSVPFRIEFEHSSHSGSLGGGDYYAAPRDSGFRDTGATELLALVGEIEAGRAWREVIDARYARDRPWLHRIVTQESRTAFFSEVMPAGDGPVLDIGSGWGQIARPLARRRPVVALEPVAERMAFIRAAARQEGVGRNLVCLECDYLEVEFRSRFDAISVIGVLEWVGAFQERADPQERQRQFLAKVRRELAPGGSLVLGIENRAGLKYLFGSPDDHLGVPHIASLPAPLARTRWHAASGHELRSFTYSRPELESMLHEAGFTTVEFFGAFPDYKLPEAIIPLADGGAALRTWLETERLPAEHNGYNGEPVPPALQALLATQYRALAAENRADFFVPSFFVRAR